MNTRKVLLSGIIVGSMALWSCENAADPGKDKVEPVVLEPTQEVISSEVENVAALAINMQTKVITDYQSLKADENKPSLQKSANPDKVYRWNPETMWHTWEDDLENAAYPDAFYGHYKRGQQHIDAQGNVVKKPDNAIGIYFYYLTFGKWGYVNDEPTGTSWDHNMSTEANPGIAIITPDGYLFSGDANYHTTWDGYYTDNSGTYNNTLVRFETKVNMNVEELLISMDGTSAQLYGTLHFEMLPWTADLSANGEDTISGTLKYNGVDVAPLSFSVAELMQKAQSLLP